MGTANTHGWLFSKEIGWALLFGILTLAEAAIVLSPRKQVQVFAASANWMYSLAYLSFAFINHASAPNNSYALACLLYAAGYAAFAVSPAATLVQIDINQVWCSMLGSFAFTAGSISLLYSCNRPVFGNLRSFWWCDEVFSVWGSVYFLLGSVIFLLGSAAGLSTDSSQYISFVRICFCLGACIFVPGRLYFLAEAVVTSRRGESSATGAIRSVVPVAQGGEDGEAVVHKAMV